MSNHMKFKFILVLPDGEKVVLKHDRLMQELLESNPVLELSKFSRQFSECTSVAFEVIPDVGVIKQKWMVLWGDKLKNSHLEVRSMQ